MAENLNQEPQELKPADKPKRKRAYVPTSLYSTNKAAEYLGCSTSLVRQAVKNKQLFCKQFAASGKGRFYFEKAELDRFKSEKEAVTIHFQEVSLPYNYYEPDPKEMEVNRKQADILYYSVQIEKIAAENKGGFKSEEARRAYIDYLQQLQDACNNYPYQEAGIRLKGFNPLHPVKIKDLLQLFRLELSYLEKSTEAPSAEQAQELKPEPEQA